MAAGRTVHTQKNRVNRQGQYVYGNVVTKPSYEPQRRTSAPKRKKNVSRRVSQNRKKALAMNRAYVTFLAVAAIFALILCVNYVQMQSRITSHSKEVSSLQKELADLKEQNNTKYNSVMDSVNLDEIREKAMNELGMVYATSDQVIEYESPSGDYVKQDQEKTNFEKNLQNYAKKASITLRGDCTGFCFIGRKNYLYQCF